MEGESANRIQNLNDFGESQGGVMDCDVALFLVGMFLITTITNMLQK